MPVSDIVYIASTVAITQGICDLIANKCVFEKEKYQNTLSALQRARIKRDKALATPPPSQLTTLGAGSGGGSGSGKNSSNAGVKAMEKYKKKIQQANDDYGMACSNVAQKHTSPQLLTSLVFLILYRVLNIEYSNKVIAVLPFEPWGIIRKLSMRGLQLNQDHVASLDFSGSTFSNRIVSVHQSCGFLFIYMLCTISVKFVVHKAMGTKPPTGADKGFMTMMDDPRAKTILTNFGVDVDEINEIRKSL